MGMLLNVDTLPEGVNCKTHDHRARFEDTPGTVWFHSGSLSPNKTNIKFDFSDLQFKEVVKAWLTGEMRWQAGVYLAGVRLGKFNALCENDDDVSMLLMDSPLRGGHAPELEGVPYTDSLLIGPQDFGVVVDYWMTNTTIKPNDPRTELLGESTEIRAGAHAQEIIRLFDEYRLQDCEHLGGKRLERARRTV